MNRPEDFMAQNLFSFVHSEFYETFSEYPINNAYKDELLDLLPKDSWRLSRNEIWLHAQFFNSEPDFSVLPLIQGFKIHISCDPQFAISILQLVVPVLVGEKVNFKIACDEKILFLLNSKLQPRGYSGKFVTIYPPNLDVFKKLLEELYLITRTRNFKGPYILSDRRYKNSHILYYRYGGFHPPSQLNIDGTKTSFLVSPDGEFIPDQRLPFFKLPPWVNDPFVNGEPVEMSKDNKLNDRYVIEGTFGFSNSGGVYYGVDTLTGQQIVIKEARPYTNCWKVNNTYWDALYLLEREFEILKHLQNSKFIPNPIELFSEGGHLFLVEERVNGSRLDSFWAQDDLILAPYIRRKGTVDRFIKKFKLIAKLLIQLVSEIHRMGVIIGDLSSRNILIDTDSYNIWLIDFESAILQNEVDSDIIEYASRWGTEGFTNPERQKRQKLLQSDDFYSLGMILYNAVVPANNMFSLNPGAKTQLLDEFVKLGLPREVNDIITKLLSGFDVEAYNIIENWTNETPIKIINLSQDSFPLSKKKIQINSTIRKISNYICATADYTRNDRLWPAHYSVFLTNPLNISYGACGIILFLLKTSDDLPSEIKCWILNQPKNHEKYPPGLYLGLAGIAYTFDQMGNRKEAEEIMDQLYQSPLLYKEANLFLGSAGWGFISLYFFIETENNKYLEFAVNSGEYLAQTAQYTSNGQCFWHCNYEDKVHYGYGYGASGIGLFLLYLYVATNRNDFLNLAIKALDFDLDQKIESEVGLQWKRFEGDNLLYPYFIHGSAGIGSIALRYFKILQNEKYKEISIKIIEDSYIKYSFIPSLFEGLAGIGELMLDAYYVLKDKKYFNYAFDIVETILWFGIEKPEGLAFPGRWLTRISNDFATGSSGIGLFLLRIKKNSSRHFLDLDIEKLKRIKKRNQMINSRL
ncbi:MAG: class III lanthionine synthetase LanKC [Cyclobacteriaceae bacterium]